MFKLSYRFSSVKLHYLEYNNQRTHNLIVLHGLLGSHKNFRTLMKNREIADLANVYLLDNRNHGESPHTSQHSYQLMAQDLKEFITSNKLKNNILLGHSMGGGVLYAFSKQFPEMQDVVKQLIIVDMAPTMRSGKKGIQSIIDGLNAIDLSQPKPMVMKHIEAIGKNKMLSDFLKTNLAVEDGHLSWVANIPVLQKNYESNIGGDIVVEPTQWRNSIDILYGQNSDVCDHRSFELLKKYYPNFSEDNIHKISNAGHWLHFENPSQFTSTLTSILSDVVKR